MADQLAKPTVTHSGKSAPLNHRLGRDFFRQAADVVAKQLLGRRIVRMVNNVRLSGIIVETEAYLGIQDAASHSFAGRRTARTETMYADGGTAYVFLNYGIHHLLNVVTEAKEIPSAVLLRALEPVEGIEVMFERRPTAKKVTDLASGPGKLGAALGVDRSLDGEDIVSSRKLFIECKPALNISSSDVVIAKRIGVDYAGEWAHKPLRFYLRGNSHVSKR